MIESNPSSTAGVINILEILHKYVPKHNNKIWKIPVNGDGLSVERMRDAKLARAGADTAEGRFDGLEPVPQEFHKRAILMQVLIGMMSIYKSNNQLVNTRSN